MIMNWSKLLGPERLNANPSRQAPIAHPASSVSVFQEDAERILYSSAFRRLQGKTQVHPLPAFDYVRTRLTHTVEVAQIGRVIAVAVANEISKRRQGGPDPIAAGDVVYAASLAHDIGNPPFGHIGEYAIQTWFEQSNLETVISLLKDDTKKRDFVHFDGNAQGFRILTRLSGWRGHGGLQLACATLATFSKYPYSSMLSKDTKKKFGYMVEDRHYAEQAFGATDLIRNGDSYCRHPLAFIVEAADDICYRTTDIEDAFRMRTLPFHSTEKLLKDIGEGGNHIPRYHELNAADEQDRISYLRAGAVSSLIDAAISVFCDREDEIMRGTMSDGLLDVSRFRDQLHEIEKTCVATIYRETRKMQTEAAGYKIIMGLMDDFGGMINQYVLSGLDKLDKKNECLYYLLPREFRDRLSRGEPYRSYLVLIDYISGMTDRYILDLYQKISGSSVTLGRMA